MQLSNYINNINEPQTIYMAKLSRELKAQGFDIVDLSIGEPDFVTPSHIIDAAKTAMDDGFTKYPPVAGFLDLRQAICEKLQRDNHLVYTPEQIVVSTGAKQSLANVLQCILNEGDEAIIPTPYWVSYATLVSMCGAKATFVDCGLDTGYKLTPELLEQAITPKTKLLIYSSPNNPTGAVYSFEELVALKNVLVKYPQIIIVSDEIYEYINFVGKHESIAQFQELKDRVVVVNGFAKGYAMTGWRLGYIAANKVLAKACEKMQSQITSGANSIAQKAAIAALLGTSEPTQQMVAAYKERRDYFIPALQAIPGFKIAMPEGAFYAFVDIAYYIGKEIEGVKVNNASDFAMLLLHNAHVTGVAGNAFGVENCIRFSFATSLDRLKIAIDRIEKLLK